jgi:hypothetical protein
MPPTDIEVLERPGIGEVLCGSIFIEVFIREPDRLTQRTCKRFDVDDGGIKVRITVHQGVDPADIGDRDEVRVSPHTPHIGPKVENARSELDERSSFPRNLLGEGSDRG